MNYMHDYETHELARSDLYVYSILYQRDSDYKLDSDEGLNRFHQRLRTFHLCSYNTVIGNHIFPMHTHHSSILHSHTQFQSQ
ncbi:hypothetical protein RIR_jg23495.t1 [Rhizophagus irregularis DAOM 181602=DAOM 197198]|nr:hypothetical protein RIR_jg23495.t1 [Rhizophagus irregularis DAOM 181602=DAOM 197198]